MLDSGCCGLAGNFGFEKGHYEVSEACAERVLLPAVRAADDADVILADGFSCRTQIEQGDSGGRGAVHLAELLAVASVPVRPMSETGPAFPPQPLRDYALLADGERGVVVGPRGESPGCACPPGTTRRCSRD